jgi:hypothetical protein
MQMDLFDVLDSLAQPKHSQQGAFLGESSRLLPWEKTEEQVGKEANPNDLSGNAAGAKSYNSRSGSILGILSEMKSQFVRDLSAAQKEEMQALIEFQSLRAAKLAEIAAAAKAQKEKEAALADLQNKVATAKKDSAALEKAVSADQKFLIETEKTCTTEDEEYHKRVKVRSEEIVALGETLKILTNDESRDLFSKSINFLELEQSGTGTQRSAAERRAAAQEVAKQSVLRRLARVAKKHGSWRLAALAVRVHLDAFSKVKEVWTKC